MKQAHRRPRPRSPFRWTTLERWLAAALCAGTVHGARVDWDGGTDSIHTSVGGSASTGSNWGPAGGGADGAGGAVPVAADNVFLNDIEGAAPATRTVTVDSASTWTSLDVTQTTEPSGGATSNVLSVASGATLTLSGATPLTSAGAASGPVVFDLASGGVLGFGYNSTASATFGANTVLRGDGVVTNSNGSISLTLNVNGLLAGPRIELVNANRANRLLLGATAAVSGAQTWRLDHGNFITTSTFGNAITDPTRWENGAVTYEAVGGCALSMEAATSTNSPGTASHYKFASIQLSSGNKGQAHIIARFTNTVQNDTQPGDKEAVYAPVWNVVSAGDSSGGHFLLDLNGQDLYADRFSQMTRFQGKSLQFVNTAQDSTSSVRAIDVAGDVLHGGSFAVMNGSTLELVGGSWHDAVYNRSVGNLPADSSAVPNSATGGTDVDKTRRWDDTAASGHASFNHYLGSGQDDAGNTRTLYEGTDGTLRIVGGDYTTSGYVLNPLGVEGTVDTLSANPAYPDETLDAFVVRANAFQTVTNLSTETGVFLAPGHRFTAGTPLLVRGSTQPGGFSSGVLDFYYVVNPTADEFQLSATAGGSPVVPTSTGAGLTVQDANGQGNLTAQPGFIVAGDTTVRGHLVLPVVGGAAAYAKGAAVCAPVFQPTLRVGGVLPVRTTVTVDAETDVLTLESGSMTDGQPVWLSATTMPGGLTLGQAYYVRDASGASFRLCAWPGEAAIDVTSEGASVATVRAEPSGTASLTVEGDLLVEAREIGGYLRNGANISIASTVGDGATVTVTCTLNHGLVPGDTITVTGGVESFRGTFAVQSVPSPLVFTYEAAASDSGGTSIVVTYAKPVSVNVAIQSNATVTVAGDLAIGGVGLPQNCLVTGVGPGIDPFACITLDGGLATTQTVAVLPAVGLFRVGEGNGGTLTGTPACASLSAPLTVAGGLSVNGDSRVIGDGDIALTNGADAVFGTTAAVEIGGALTVAAGSVVDLSAGSVAVGSLTVADGGLVDFGTRADVDGSLRVDGDAVAALSDVVAAGGVVSARGPLHARYVASGDYTTLVRDLGSILLVR